MRWTFGIALAEIAGIAERRIFRLTDPNLNDGLPAMLVEGGGLNSGFMLAQYVAAALAADNKVLAHPDGVGSLPTSADQEDHISNSMNAARHAWQILRKVERVVGIELVTAAQALDFRLKADPHVKLGAGTAAAHTRVRQDIAHLERVRLMYLDLDRGAELVRSGEIVRAVEEALDQQFPPPFGRRVGDEGNLLSLVPRAIILAMNTNAISQIKRPAHHAHAHVRCFSLGRV